MNNKRSIREEEKTAERLFIEAMQYNHYISLDARMKFFKRPAEKGHQESQFIWSVYNSKAFADLGAQAAFQNTNCAIGYYWASEMSCNGVESMILMRKSSECGYSWGQIEYAIYMRTVLKKEKEYVDIIERLATQNHPRAQYLLGMIYKANGQHEKAIFYLETSVNAGWNTGALYLSDIFYKNEYGFRNLVKFAKFCSANYLARILDSLKYEAYEESGCDPNILALEIGKKQYWWFYGHFPFREHVDKEAVTAKKYLKYYCYMMELQQQSIFQFLYYWNEMGGIKDIGKMIAKKVWESRYTNPIKSFVQ